MQQDTNQAAVEETAGGQAEQDGYGMEPRGAYTVLSNRDYLFYVLARSLVTIGQQSASLGIGWDLYARTSDPMALAYVGLVQFLPVLVLALPAGHAADRFDRKAILQITQVILVFCSLALAAVSGLRAPVPLVYLCLLAAGLARSLSGPARAAMLPNFVPRSDYETAIKWNTTIMRVAQMLGPALGGTVIAIGHGALAAFLLDVICGVAAFVLTAMAIPRFASPRAAPMPLTLENLTAGLRFVWRTRIILATITLDLFAVLFGGATALLPIYARDILHVGSEGFGWLRGAPAAGALVMAITLSQLPPMRRPGVSMLWAVAGFGVATIVFGLSRSFLLSLAMLFLTGALDMISVVVRSTLVQTLTPDEMLGRVSAVNQVFISSSNQLGDFESGVVARLVGPILSVVFGGIGTLAVVASVALAWPEVRRFDPRVSERAP